MIDDERRLHAICMRFFLGSYIFYVKTRRSDRRLFIQRYVNLIEDINIFVHISNYDEYCV